MVFVRLPRWFVCDGGSECGKAQIWGNLPPGPFGSVRSRTNSLGATGLMHNRIAVNVTRLTYVTKINS